jgi:hypothetical protein
MKKGDIKLAAAIWTKKNIFWSALLTMLGIVCFPVNPLVLSGLLVTGHNQVAYIVGWMV